MRVLWLGSAGLALMLAGGAMAGAGPAGRAAAQNLAVPHVAVGELKAVSCSSAVSCFAVGGANVVATTYDGAGWTSVTAPPHVFDLVTLACPSRARCLVAGSRDGDAGAVYATADGGTTWRIQSAAVPGGFFLAISCASRAVCVATGNGGAVFSTVDAGRTWHGQSLTNVSLINGIDCVTTTVCEAVAYSGHADAFGVALRTTDGGLSWVEQPLPSSVPFPEAVACPSIDTCVAVGQNTVLNGSRQVGVIAVTRDGGTTWRRRQVPDGYTNLSGVDCPDIAMCEAVGYGPKAVLGTVDGGRTWTPQGPATTVLRGISCPNPSTCTAVGETDTGRGAIYRTTTGGSTWRRQPIG